MKLSEFIPARTHNAMKWIGTKDWLRIKVDPAGETGTKYEIDTNVLSHITLDDQQRFTNEDFGLGSEIVRRMRTSTMGDCMFTHSLSTAMATGFKLFQPTFEQCLVIENTKVTIPFAEYYQPFPVVTIELPEEYKQHLRDHFNHEHVPSYVLAYRHESGFLIISAWFSRDDVIVLQASPMKRYKHIEDCIVTNGLKSTYDSAVEEYGKEYADKAKHLWKATTGDQKDYPIAEMVQRLGLNFSYALATLGATKPKALNKDAHKKNLAAIRNPKTNERKKERARRFLAGTVYVVAFEQEITISRDVAAVADSYRSGRQSESGDGQARFVKPHFRRGHWREQACGPGLKERKRVLIDPVLVNKKFFIGDLSDTFVSMKIEDDFDPASLT